MPNLKGMKLILDSYPIARDIAATRFTPEMSDAELHYEVSRLVQITMCPIIAAFSYAVKYAGERPGLLERIDTLCKFYGVSEIV